MAADVDPWLHELLHQDRGLIDPKGRGGLRAALKLGIMLYAALPQEFRCAAAEDLAKISNRNLALRLAAEMWPFRALLALSQLTRAQQDAIAEAIETRPHAVMECEPTDADKARSPRHPWGRALGDEEPEGLITVAHPPVQREGFVEERYTHHKRPAAPPADDAPITDQERAALRVLAEMSPDRIRRILGQEKPPKKRRA